MVRKIIENENEKSLAIKKIHVPAEHPDLSASYNNIGSIHYYVDHYDLALKYYDRSSFLFSLYCTSSRIQESIMDSGKHDAGYRSNQEQFDAATDDNKAIQILLEIYNNASQYSNSSSDSDNENK
ncbi:unnamed protein product [Rotaria magnacalcarata]